MTDLSGARTPDFPDPQAQLWTRSFALVWAITFLPFFFALRAQG
jgi:hypothetical protein